MNYQKRELFYVHYSKSPHTRTWRLFFLDYDCHVAIKNLFQSDEVQVLIAGVAKLIFDLC